MKEQAKEFIRKINSDESLKKEFFEVNAQMKAVKNRHEMFEKYILPFAKKSGYDLTEKDFEVTDEELSEEELKAVAGGSCHCDLGGGGTGHDHLDDEDYSCACLGHGQGGEDSDKSCLCYAPGAGSDYVHYT